MLNYREFKTLPTVVQYYVQLEVRNLTLADESWRRPLHFGQILFKSLITSDRKYGCCIVL